MDKKQKMPSNSAEEHDAAVAGKDPTQAREDLEDLAREAVKKFKSMG